MPLGLLGWGGHCKGTRPAQLPESGDPLLEDRKKGLGRGHCPVGVRTRGMILRTVAVYAMQMNASYD